MVFPRPAGWVSIACHCCQQFLATYAKRQLARASCILSKAAGLATGALATAVRLQWRILDALWVVTCSERLIDLCVVPPTVVIAPGL